MSNYPGEEIDLAEANLFVHKKLIHLTYANGKDEDAGFYTRLLDPENVYQEPGLVLNGDVMLFDETGSTDELLPVIRARDCNGGIGLADG